MRTLRPALVAALILAPTFAAAAPEVPEWVSRTHEFSFAGAALGAQWLISIDHEGNFRAEAGTDAVPVACPVGMGECNSDACVTQAVAAACDGIANGTIEHQGRFLLLAFTGTIATSPSGGTMTDRLVYSCTTWPSCRPTNTVEFTCTFAPGTLHLVGVWGSEGGSCAFTSWNGNQNGNTFTFSGSQTGDMVGLVSHTVH